MEAGTWTACGGHHGESHRQGSHFRRSAAPSGGGFAPNRILGIAAMKINKEIRQLSKGLLRSSFTDGQLDSGRIASLVKSLIEKKPRHYLQVLEAYKRLLRLEVEKRTATIETATELPPEAGSQIV